jgi:hypothetical protein
MSGVLKATTGVVSGSALHSDLGSIGANDHHNQIHGLVSSDHTVSGLTTGHVLKALSATTFGFADAGFVEEETDPVFSAWDKSTGISITESQISDLQAYLTAETDPIVGAITGIVKANGAGVISAAVVGTDYDNYWSRASTTISPRTAGDNITTTGKGTFDTLDIGTTSKEWGEGDYALTIHGLLNGNTTSLAYIPVSDNWPPSSSGGAKMIIGWNNTVGSQFDLGDYIAIGSVHSTDSLIITTKNLAGNNFLTRLDISGGVTNATADWKTTHLSTSGNIKIKSDSNRLYLGADEDSTLWHSDSTLMIRADNVSAAATIRIRSGTTGIYFDIGASSYALMTADKFYFNNNIQITDGHDISKDTSDLTITTASQKTVVLSQPVWNDINMSGAVMSLVDIATQRDEFVDSTGTDTGIETWALAVDEYVQGCFEIMHDYKEGTDLYFHVHWQGIAAPTGTDNVRWELTYTISREDVVLAAASTIEIETSFDTQYEFKRSDFAAITGTNFEIGDQFLFRLTRITASGDAYAGNALLATVGIHYQVDTIGSRQISTK